MIRSLRYSCRILLLLTLPAAVFGQGSLTPPGAPAPTMKSLDQIESRALIPGGTTAATISQPGSYYLTGNLTVDGGDAITITAANVTLDLRGFTVATTATSPAGTAVKISGRRTTVCNGNVSNSQGSALGDSGTGINCSAAQNSVGSAFGTGGKGLTCVIAQNSFGTTYGNGGAGISSTNALNCLGTAAAGTNATGLVTTTAVGCQGTADGGIGLDATAAEACKGISTTYYGMRVLAGSECNGETGASIGIFSDGTLNACSGHNTTSGSYSIRGNVLIGCTYGVGPIGYNFKFNMP